MKVLVLLLVVATGAAAAAVTPAASRPRKRLPLVSTDVVPSPEPGSSATEDAAVDEASRPPAKQYQRNQHLNVLFPPGLEGPEPSNSTKCFHIRVSRHRGRRRHQRRRKGEGEGGDATDAPSSSTAADPEDASDVLTVRKNRKHLIPSAFICTNNRKKNNRRRKGSGASQRKHDDADADADAADEDVDAKTRRRRRLSHMALRSLQRETV